MQEPRIEILGEKKLIGKRLIMSFSNDRTVELWKSFMPKRNEISKRVSQDLFCLQFYDNIYEYKDFSADTVFEKWAAAEVADGCEIPEGMELLTLNGGLYAVFLYVGAASNFQATFHYIFGVWLPNSIYELDQRAHFEILGAKYKNNDPESEEEIWVPIKNHIDT